MSWSLYDALLSEIPSSIRVEEVLQNHWWLVDTGSNMGISMYFEQGVGRPRTLPEKLAGMPLKALAEYVKSWNFFEATLGVAAINAYYNATDKMKALGADFSDDAFITFEKEIKGKKVAVVGHFPALERLQAICDLSILEKNPQEGDYPDSACEYILPEQEHIFITGTTLANKTLPRLLELGKNAKIVLAGPSVPLAPVLFDYGVDVLASTVACDFDVLRTSLNSPDARHIFGNGAKMVQLS